jgi:hypothetical protein
MLGGLAGSDHNAFLDKGIPAICFTSDVTFPIHTPQDNWANFTFSGLQRSGDLVDGLIRRFDDGVPSRETESYYLVQVGTRPFFIPHSILWSIIVITLLIGLGTLVSMRRERLVLDPAVRVKWNRVKMLLFVLIVMTFVWLSETAAGFVLGYRFPWVNNFGWYVLLGLAAGGIGLWVVLRLLGWLRLSPDPYAFANPSLLILLLLTAGSALRGAEVALYPAVSLLLVAFAFVSNRKRVQVFFLLLAPIPLLRLIFFEEVGLMQRLLAQNMIHTPGGVAAYEASFVVLSSLLALPFAHAYVCVCRNTGYDVLWLTRLRSLLAPFVAAALCGLIVGMISSEPVYNRTWYNNARIDQRYRVGEDSSEFVIRGSEHVSGLKGNIGTYSVVIDNRTNYFTPKVRENSRVSWLSMTTGYDFTAVTPDSVLLTRKYTLHSVFRPLSVKVTVAGDSAFGLSSPWSFNDYDFMNRTSDRVKVLEWYSFPDTHLVIPLTYRMRRGQAMVASFEATYDTLSYPIRLSRDFTNVRYRTYVTVSDTVRDPQASR